MDSIDKLAKKLQREFENGTKLEDMKDIIKMYSGSDWELYERFSEISYTRNIAFRNDAFEIMIICWNGNQKTPIHDHPSNGCIVKLLKGSLIEESYKIIDGKPVLSKINELSKDSLSYQKGKDGIHRIVNPTDKHSITLHVYSPPNYVFTAIKN